MELPPSFDKGIDLGRVCKLKKSLYGLKQSPRAWFDRFRKVVRQLGYKQTTPYFSTYRQQGGNTGILSWNGEMLRNNSGIFVSWRKYILDLR